MNFKVNELAVAQADIEGIFNWLLERSRQGAESWLEAYEQLLATLSSRPLSFPLAQENDDCEFEIREALFKTRHDRTYRAIFFIDENVVNIARIRGPGQANVRPDNLL